MVLSSKYEIGQIVYLKTDKDQNERMITGILWKSSIQYELKSGNTGSWHEEYEITEDKNVLTTTIN